MVMPEELFVRDLISFRADVLKTEHYGAESLDGLYVRRESPDGRITASFWVRVVNGHHMCYAIVRRYNGDWKRGAELRSMYVIQPHTEWEPDKCPVCMVLRELGYPVERYYKSYRL